MKTRLTFEIHVPFVEKAPNLIQTKHLVYWWDSDVEPSQKISYRAFKGGLNMKTRLKFKIHFHLLKKAPNFIKRRFWYNH